LRKQFSNTPSCNARRQIAGPGDHDRRPDILKDVTDLAFPVQYIDRDEDYPQFHAGKEKVNDAKAVRKVDAEPVSLFESAVGQETSHPVAPDIEVPEGKLLAYKLESGKAPPLLKGQIK
jgi:hypothetical protein